MLIYTPYTNTAFITTHQMLVDLIEFAAPHRQPGICCLNNARRGTEINLTSLVKLTKLLSALEFRLLYHNIVSRDSSVSI
jgi:hypothetical protein